MGPASVFVWFRVSSSNGPGVSPDFGAPTVGASAISVMALLLLNTVLQQHEVQFNAIGYNFKVLEHNTYNITSVNESNQLVADFWFARYPRRKEAMCQ